MKDSRRLALLSSTVLRFPASAFTMRKVFYAVKTRPLLSVREIPSHLAFMAGFFPLSPR